MVELWAKNTEIEFFKQARTFAQPEQLFYKTPENTYVAYWPKGYKGTKTTLQSRNSLIGSFTEKWSVDLLKEFAEKNKLYAKQGVICEEIGLNNKSPADVAFCKTDELIQTPENIITIFEVKMSIVWNWNLITEQEKESFNLLSRIYYTEKDFKKAYEYTQDIHDFDYLELLAKKLTTADPGLACELFKRLCFSWIAKGAGWPYKKSGKMLEVIKRIDKQGTFFRQTKEEIIGEHKKKYSLMEVIERI